MTDSGDRPVAIAEGVASARTENLTALFKDSTASNYGQVAHFAVTFDAEQIPDRLRDQRIPAERRFGIMNALVADSMLPGQWADWCPLLMDASQDPRLRALVVTAFRSRLEWEDIQNLLKTPNLPFELRRAIFRNLWEHGIPWSHGYVDVIGALLEIESAPEVAMSAFSSLPPRLSGPISTERLDQILTMLRDVAVPSRYRAILARAISPFFDPITEDDRRRIVDLFIDEYLLADLTPANPAWDPILYFTSSAVAPAIRRDLLRDPRLSIRLRIDLWNRNPDRQEIFDVVRHTDLLIDERVELAKIIASPSVPVSLLSDLEEAARKGDATWRELITLPAFRQKATAALVETCVNPEHAKLVRDVAKNWVLYELHEDVASMVPTLREVLAQLRDPRLDTAAAGHMGDILARCYFTVGLASQILPMVARALEDSAIPVAHRARIIRALDSRFFNYRPAILWEAATRSRSPRLQGMLLHRLCDACVLVDHPELRKACVRLIRARSQAELAQAETIWREISRVASLFRSEPLELIAIASDATEDELRRAVAVQRFADCDLDADGQRRVWAYAADPRNADLWLNARLRDAITLRLGESIGNAKLARAITGPGQALWEAVAALALLPDLGLAGEALNRLGAPESGLWTTWLRSTPNLPKEASLAAFHLGCVWAIPFSDFATTLDQVFAQIHSQSLRADLTHALIRATVKPDNIKCRIAKILGQCMLSEDLVGVPPRELIDLLRFARLEAQIVAREEQRDGTDFVREPDLNPAGQERLEDIPSGTSVREAARRLRASVIRRLLPGLVGLKAEQFARVLQETDAPAVLAGQYARIHPSGIPLLASAVKAASRGSEAWQAWRFHRREALRQLPQLEPQGVACWQEDLTLPVGTTTIPDDVRTAAARIRDRFARAIKDGEIPDLYRSMLDGILDAQSRARRIHDLRAVSRSLGMLLGDRSAAFPEDLIEALPGDLRADFSRVLDPCADNKDMATGAPTTNDPRARQALMNLRHRVERGIDLLRLLDCDEKSLVRNKLRARGELGEDGAQAESALVHLQKMRYAFAHPATRAQQQRGGAVSHQLDAALAEASEVLRAVKTFAPGRRLVAEERSDFKTLIEIGNNPYAQGSCQNYASSNENNKGLLGYVVDAMTKAIVIRSGDEQGGQLLARAIVKLGTSLQTNQPVLVIERVYAAGGEIAWYAPMIAEAAQEFAARRGWLAARPLPRGREDDSPNCTVDQVRIPASQNGVQYEDGHAAILTSLPAGLSEGEYTLQVTYTLATENPAE